MTKYAHCCEAPECEDEGTIQAEAGEWFCEDHFAYFEDLEAFKEAEE